MILVTCRLFVESSAIKSRSFAMRVCQFSINKFCI